MYPSNTIVILENYVYIIGGRYWQGWTSLQWKVVMSSMNSTSQAIQQLSILSKTLDYKNSYSSHHALGYLGKARKCFITEEEEQKMRSSSG